MIELHRSLARAVVVLVAALTGSMAVVASTAPAAGASDLPGMCYAPTDASVIVNAHAVSGQSKYVLNVESDVARNVTGVLVLDHGKDRLHVEQWCRLWRHGSGSGGGSGHCSPPTGDDIAVHAIGIGVKEGVPVLVRTDVRTFQGTPKFRIRYRPIGTGDHDSHVADHDGDGCGDDEGWTKVPPEGWDALARLNARFD